MNLAVALNLSPAAEEWYEDFLSRAMQPTNHARKNLRPALQRWTQLSPEQREAFRLCDSKLIALGKNNCAGYHYYTSKHAGDLIAAKEDIDRLSIKQIETELAIASEFPALLQMQSGKPTDILIMTRQQYWESVATLAK